MEFPGHNPPPPLPNFCLLGRLLFIRLCSIVLVFQNQDMGGENDMGKKSGKIGIWPTNILDLTARNGDSLGLIPFGYLEHGRPWAIYFSIKHRGSTMKNLEWGDIYGYWIHSMVIQPFANWNMAHLEMFYSSTCDFTRPCECPGLSQT